MEKYIYHNSFNNYLIDNGIKVVNNSKNKKIKYITEDMIYDQLKLIKHFHEISSSYAKQNKNNFKSSIGKIVESYKVDLKKVKRYLQSINYPKNNFEEFILNIGFQYIKIAEESVSQMYNSQYIKLIARSMNRNEVCLGDTYFNNLWQCDKGIQIKNLNKCSYDMVEIDCYYLLNKLRKKGINFSWDKLVREFCKMENLNDCSSKFILALMSYPYEFIKYCNKYRLNKKNWSNEQYVDKLKKSLALEEKFLI